MDTKDSPTFSFIIVNYHSARHLPACFSSFQNLSSLGTYECIVANNDPDEESDLQTLSSRFPFTILPLKENRGFGFAINRAVEIASGRILVFLNPDARFLSGDMQTLVHLYENRKNTGLVGFSLLLEPETPQPWNAGGRVTLFTLIRNHLGLAKSFSTEISTRTVSWVSGAASAIPRDLFCKLHGFDERFFLYYEDVDLCRRAEKSGKKNLFFPDIRVLHIGGGSMSHADTKQKQAYYTAQDRYFKKHRPLFERWLLKFLRGITLL